VMSGILLGMVMSVCTCWFRKWLPCLLGLFLLILVHVQTSVSLLLLLLNENWIELLLYPNIPVARNKYIQVPLSARRKSFVRHRNTEF
jgi:hypothetical protein